MERTKVLSWLCIFHVHLCRLIQHNIHELIEALQMRIISMSVDTGAVREQSAANKRLVSISASRNSPRIMTRSTPSLHLGFQCQGRQTECRTRTMIRPSMRISMLSYSHITTFVLYSNLSVKIMTVKSMVNAPAASS